MTPTRKDNAGVLVEMTCRELLERLVLPTAAVGRLDGNGVEDVGLD
jgi:hypothetical protein